MHSGRYDPAQGQRYSGQNNGGLCILFHQRLTPQIAGKRLRKNNKRYGEYDDSDTGKQQCVKRTEERHGYCATGSRISATP